MKAHRLPSSFVWVIAGIGAILFPARCPAQEGSNPDSPEASADIAGCSDLQEVSRLPSSKIVSCDKGDSVEVTMPLKPDARGYAREKSVRGAYEFREYQITQADLQEQAFNNLAQLLPIKGFEIKFSSNPSTITGHKEGVWILINLSGEYYDVKLVRVNEDPWTPVKDANEISREMEKHQRVAIYGIVFSPEDQSVLGENSPILAEVLKYLSANPRVAVVVESHKTGETGTAEDDQEITRTRANAVVSWLKTHGIAAERLVPKPLGRSKPIADTDTPLENQRNDRIELAVAK